MRSVLFAPARWIGPRLFAVCVLMTGISCKPAKLPGQSLGVYAITGSLTTNECGNQAVPAINPLVFEVELRYDGQQAYWHREGLPMVSGAISAAGAFTFQTQNTWTAIAADAVSGYAGCFIAQQDTIHGTVSLDSYNQADASDQNSPTANTSWSGQQVIQMSPVSGSDCQPAMLHAGGSFHELPCSIHYDLLGTRLANAGG